MVGINDLSVLDSTSNSSSTKSEHKGANNQNISAKEKLIRDKRIHEQNLVSLRKKLGLELANKRKDIAQFKTVKENCATQYELRCKEFADRQAELV